MAKVQKKALISVSDKTGLLDFSRVIAQQFEILSTAGTFQLLSNEGISVQKIEDYTGIPELLGGKVKTLHPKIFAGILCVEESDLIPAIRLVVVNLYPVGKKEIDILDENVDEISEVQNAGDGLVNLVENPHPFFLAPKTFTVPLSLAPDLGFSQLPGDGWGQTLEISFDDIVMGARFHRGHCEILTRSPGNKDEGDVEAGLL